MVAALSRGRSVRSLLRAIARCAPPAALAVGALVQAAGAQTDHPVAGPPLGIEGTIRFYGSFPSRFVAPRNVEVWLPPGYARDTTARYPVLYVQDGQNAFDPATSYIGVDWGLDETMTRLIAADSVRPAIMVAIWNTPKRFDEYMPEKAVRRSGAFGSGVPGLGLIKGRPISDDYLRFMVQELKPFIDRTYRTLPGPGDTFIMGSSMGGLIAAYAVMEYPKVFGGAACLSTHWPAADGAFVTYFTRAIPAAASHKFYFDHGTETLDAQYGPYQAKVDSAMRAAGYVEGRNWISRVLPGADHSERSWRVRVNVPLEFLLGR